MRANFFSILVPAIAAALLFSAAPSAQALEQDRGKASFEPLLGWWKGDGRLAWKNGKSESVKCRATYRWQDEDQKLLQTVRCATASGKVEVKSEIAHLGNELTGKWSETIYELSGDLTGKINPNGFVVKVSGGTLSANMDVMVKDARQIVEIQFHENETLIGMSVIFVRGSSS